MFVIFRSRPIRNLFVQSIAKFQSVTDRSYLLSLSHACDTLHLFFSYLMFWLFPIWYLSCRITKFLYQLEWKWSKNRKLDSANQVGSFVISPNGIWVGSTQGGIFLNGVHCQKRQKWPSGSQASNSHLRRKFWIEPKFWYDVSYIEDKCWKNQPYLTYQ